MADIRIFPELVKATPDAPLLANLAPEKAVLGMSEHHGVPVEQVTQALKVFIEGITNLYEEDYGDFMREVNAHLLDLSEVLQNSSPEIRNKLSGIQHYLQFHPNWDIETTRQKVLLDAQSLLDTVTGTLEEPPPPLNPS